MTVQTGIDEVDAVLAEEWPRMQWERVGTGLAATALVIAGLWGGTAAFQSDEPKLAGVIVVLPIMCAFWLVSALRRSHERRLVPVLARVVGLEFDSDPGKQRSALPHALLPQGIEKSEDMLSGKFGGRHISAVEVKIETGGKNSSTLFDGFVVTVPNLVKEVEFVLALDSQTKSGFLSPARHDVSGLTRLGSYSRWGRSYGLFGPARNRTPEAVLREFVDAVITVEGELGHGAEVHAMARTPYSMSVAVKHPRDLYRLGGLFAGKAALGQQIQRAFDDLKLPLKVVERLIAAEAKLAPAPAAPAGLSAVPAPPPPVPPDARPA